VKSFFSLRVPSLKNGFSEDFVVVISDDLLAFNGLEQVRMVSPQMRPQAGGAALCARKFLDR